MKKDWSLNYDLYFRNGGLIIDMDGQERQILQNLADVRDTEAGLCTFTFQRRNLYFLAF
jgi:hypothetical protein